MGEDFELTRAVILLDGSSGPNDELVTHVAELGFVPVCCPTFEAAEAALECAEDPIHCTLIPTEFADRGLKRGLKNLRKRGVRAGLHLVAVGPEPDRSTRKRLRSAGIHYALWEPLEESTLRFQLNRLTHSLPNNNWWNRSSRAVIASRKSCPR